LQQWFNLSDPAVEEALYDSAVMRQFVGIDLGQEAVPDETTACKFRHLLEEHQLGEQNLGTVNVARDWNESRSTKLMLEDLSAPLTILSALREGQPRPFCEFDPYRRVLRPPSRHHVREPHSSKYSGGSLLVRLKNHPFSATA
jgi:IS5 family transposase